MTVPVAAPPNHIPVQIEVTGDSRHSISGEIWSASEGFLRLLLRLPVEVPDRLEMSIDGCDVSGEVVFCQPCPGGYNVGVQLLDGNSARREPRFPVDLPAVLTVVGSAGLSGAIIRVADVSASGVGLFGPEPVEIGACVEIKLDLGILFGEVRYCQMDEDKQFRIGVAIYHMLARNNDVKAPKSASSRFRWLRRAAAHRPV